MARDDTPSATLRPGVYETLLTAALRRLVDGLPQDRVVLAKLDDTAATPALVAHLQRVLRRALSGSAEEQAVVVAQLADAALQTLPPHEREALAAEAALDLPPRELLSVAKAPTAGPPRHPRRPRTRLSESALMTNAPGDESLLHAIVAELDSADEVDLLCAFVRLQGVRLLEEPLEALVARGGQLRVLTSTYMAGTERLALDRLASLGAEVRVGYETKSTRLHAKAWLLRRHSGCDTAFVGSSNMSHSALVDGLEWNVRLSYAESPHLIAKFAATFESYWQSDSFGQYDPQRDGATLQAALNAERPDGRGGGVRLQLALGRLDVRPYAYQQAMLDQLEAERSVHGRTRSLVVAATGTGKTVLAALDFRRLREAHRQQHGPRADLRLLFVAHRREILDQSRATFAAVLGDANFGERLVAGDVPADWRHVFASIQSLDGRDDIAADHFDVVIMDEFHHAAAPTYDDLLATMRPNLLLGLTATPERADGRDVLHHFGGHIAVELRLWDALDQQLLCPFHYFGVSDGTDLRNVQWRTGGYATEELERVYTADDARLRIVLQTLARKVGDLAAMRAIGFCVSREHARYMARRFNEAGIPALAVLGTTDDTERDAALRRLRDREVNVLFAVDIYNEGVDVPDVDTLLMLRPTESATVFLQQLGRGLRKARDKACCTVLDFVGQQHRKFRFDLRLRALTGGSRRDVQHGVDDGFDRLPAGCAIDLDRNLRTQILAQLKESLPNREAAWIAEVQRLGPDASLSQVLHALAVDPDELYRSKRSLTKLRRAAFPHQPAHTPAADREGEAKVLARLQSLLHIDDPERVGTYRTWLANAAAPQVTSLDARGQRLAAMLHVGLRGLDQAFGDLQASLDQVWRCRDLCAELDALLAENLARRDTPTRDVAWLRPVPMLAHARYSRDEVRAALGVLDLARPWKHREGVLYSEANALDVFFVTLEKAEAQFSPSTRYRDYALSDALFHWESQNSTTPASRTGRRYIDHRAQGSRVALFVRERNEDARGLPEAFVCLGFCDYVSHRGSAPIAITWRLQQPMPARTFERAKAVAG